jgi:protein involved in polysaccharide export with SLBB domain
VATCFFKTVLQILGQAGSRSGGRRVDERMNSRIAIVFLVVLFSAQSGLGYAQDSDVAATYKLSAGDRVLITVFGHEDLSGEFEINGAGVISMPLIPDVDAAGLTVNELEAAIVDALKPDYLRNPIVSAEVVTFRPIYIIGEVVNPGSYPYTNGMTVINAVAVAGGFSYRAKKSKLVIRRDDGKQTIEIRVDLDTVVLPADVIEVPERFF